MISIIGLFYSLKSDGHYLLFLLAYILKCRALIVAAVSYIAVMNTIT